MHSSDLCKVILNYFTMDTTSKHSAVAPTHFLNLSRTNQQILFVLLLIVCLTFSVSPPIALLLGLLIANLSGHPFLRSVSEQAARHSRFSPTVLGCEKKKAYSEITYSYNLKEDFISYTNYEKILVKENYFK